MQKILLITAIFFIALIAQSTAASHSSTAVTQSCENYPDKINHLQELNARGGSAKQQAQRRERISGYEAALSKCRNSKKIAVAYGPQKTIDNQRKKMQLNASQPPQLQQLIKTCNYWVEQTKLYPSWDNSNFRDSACRAADERQKNMHDPSPKIAPNLRKLSDCIKPNNVIDDQVNACIKGTGTASWKK